MLPAGAGPYFDAWREAQGRYLPMVEEQFAPVPVRTVPFFDSEMVGVERLAELGRGAVRRLRPVAVPVPRPALLRSSREGGEYVLSVELPFTSKDEISLSRKADELVLQVGGWRRNLVLPRLLLDAPTKGAKMEDRVLRVRFGQPVKSIAGGERNGQPAGQRR